MSDTTDRFIEEFGEDLRKRCKLDDADWIQSQDLEDDDTGEVYLFVTVRSKDGLYKLRLETGPLFSKYWDDEDMLETLASFLQVEEDAVEKRLRKAGVIR